MDHPLQCRCGTIKGYVSHPERTANRCICYCRDCQSFAHFLGRPDEILDRCGGTDIIQTLPKHVTFAAGTSSLGCMRLTDKGLFRWYAICCNTPIGNTLGNFRLSLVGLVHDCLRAAGTSLGDAFGPVRGLVNTRGAIGSVEGHSSHSVSGLLRVMALMTRARIDGSYKHTPFFNVAGEPVVAPRILTATELQNLR